MNEREQLFETVEEVRAAGHQDLDAELVREILSIQLLHQEDRAEANRRTERAISRWADQHATETDA